MHRIYRRRAGITSGAKGKVHHAEVRKRGHPGALGAFQKLNNGNLKVNEGMAKTTEVSSVVDRNMRSSCKIKIRAKVAIPGLSCMEVKHQTPFPF